VIIAVGNDKYDEVNISPNPEGEFSFMEAVVVVTRTWANLCRVWADRCPARTMRKEGSKEPFPQTCPDRTDQADRKYQPNTVVVLIGAA